MCWLRRGSPETLDEPGSGMLRSIHTQLLFSINPQALDTNSKAFNCLTRASQGTMDMRGQELSLAGLGSLDATSLELRLSACIRHSAEPTRPPPQALLQCSPAPGCTRCIHTRAHTHTHTHTHTLATGPGDLPGKPGPSESAWCAANCSLQSRL